MTRATTPRTGAIILAAGRSTRFRSARSKLVHPLAGRPIIGWLLGTLRELAIDPVVVVVAPDADEVRAICGTDVRFAVQRTPRGTGHAVLAAQASLRRYRGDLLLLYGDLPLLRAETLRRLVEAHRAGGGQLTLATGHVVDAHGWGRIVRGADGRVRRIVEQKDASAEERAIREVNVGLYCVRAPLLFDLLGRVRPNNAQREIYLTDIVALAAAAGMPIADVAVDLSEVAQINSRRELAAVEQQVRARIAAAWMDAGVTLQDPATAYIDPDVRIGRDTTVGPNVHLRGRTVVGERCRIDGSAFLTDATLADDVHLRFGVVLSEAEVGAGCEIGPFAHLRPRTRLAAGVHIGDFVETKNARLGPGSKANHLAYLGDAEIGRDVNIGAGTITCNYDGFSKQRTVIGDRVQVGSDSTLVAPVTLGDDAYVATATTVREDVPAGALVFNTRQQQHRSGWVAAFRARQQKRQKKTATRQKARGRGRTPRA
ncbi:bifunctional UDP-N-acetylglucosamine diphosphorylase/glucosamine-1-phosphate N-acetyltransferase GlmU [bacterium]|nr:bifunctional UDP-N-acetylglucosamine diphosphorylase/glucosamine-1-phosphate N-acetyltransferase GlmU [bacterium]